MKNLSKEVLHVLVILIVSSISLVSAQSNVFIDDNGVMRWEDTKEEVTGFGVNYTVPFAHAYRAANRLGIDVKEAIDNDVYHFTRLGFDLYRVHVWDTQISDEKGNLIENEYLDAFDYLLKKLKQHNINYVITPIAFWGNGWPEPDIETSGFSHKYGKADCLTNPEAIKAQENYLYQFLNHVNPYTQLAYKDDSNVIAFEVSNEPHHRGNETEVTAFVKKMITAMKKTGTKKPIFYNMSHAVHFADTYFKGGAEGGTFQWYPTGLGYQKELSGNLLPNVDDYNIPFEESFKKYSGAKLVYEFDAADVGRSYIYPAMARSFRESGIQIATHFAYDPTYLADVNTEYNTHYMNLVYTPQKALSLKICSEVFREIPMYSDSGSYPKNKVFGNFKVDYELDLAEYNSNDKFFYTNLTTSEPKDEMKLKEIAGYGNSNLVKYNGLGSYFLDKIDSKTWRLEVMPDAVWVDNPFGRNSPQKTVGVVKWDEHEMQINLKDLGLKFSIEGINEGNLYKTKTADGGFKISPGTYVLSSETKLNWSKNDSFKTNKLSDFYAPVSTVNRPWFKHESAIEVTENKSLHIKIQYISELKPEKIEVVGFLGSERIRSEMTMTNAYNYELKIPADKLKEGYLKYYIIVKRNESEYLSFPANKKGQPSDWDFYDRMMYSVPVVKSTSKIELFNALKDSGDLVRQWRRGIELKPTPIPNEAEYQIKLEKLYNEDNENLNAKPIYDYSIKHFVIDKIESRKADLTEKKSIVFKGRSLLKAPIKIQVALVLKNGSSYGGLIELQPELKNYNLDLIDLKQVKTVTLPRPYPTFLPYFFEHENKDDFKIQNIESLQISIGPGLDSEKINKSVGVGIVSIILE